MVLKYLWNMPSTNIVTSDKMLLTPKCSWSHMCTPELHIVNLFKMTWIRVKSRGGNEASSHGENLFFIDYFINEQSRGLHRLVMPCAEIDINQHVNESYGQTSLNQWQSRPCDYLRFHLSQPYLTQQILVDWAEIVYANIKKNIWRIPTIGNIFHFKKCPSI